MTAVSGHSEEFRRRKEDAVVDTEEGRKRKQQREERDEDVVQCAQKVRQEEACQTKRKVATVRTGASLET